MFHFSPKHYSFSNINNDHYLHKNVSNHLTSSTDSRIMIHEAFRTKKNWNKIKQQTPKMFFYDNGIQKFRLFVIQLYYKIFFVCNLIVFLFHLCGKRARKNLWTKKSYVRHIMHAIPECVLHYIFIHQILIHNMTKSLELL